MKYFWQSASGVNSDIERHMREETKLRTMIEKLENKIDPSTLDKMSLMTYRNFLCKLQQSKAEAVSKIGKK